jgi:hypothetical protein
LFSVHHAAVVKVLVRGLERPGVCRFANDLLTAATSRARRWLGTGAVRCNVMKPDPRLLSGLRAGRRDPLRRVCGADGLFRYRHFRAGPAWSQDPDCSALRLGCGRVVAAHELGFWACDMEWMRTLTRSSAAVVRLDSAVGCSTPASLTVSTRCRCRCIPTL